MDISSNKQAKSYKRETEVLLIAEQNNAIRTNHINAKIDNTQKKMAQLSGAGYNTKQSDGESVREKETQRIFSDFEIQTNQSILTLRTNLSNKKKTCHLLSFVIPRERK